MNDLGLHDFTDCPNGNRVYGGSDGKDSIIYNGSRYMVKFSEKRHKKLDFQTSYVNNALSEYIGSHIFQSIGIPTHETLLGVMRWDGERLAVACKDFCEDGHELHPFGWFMLNLYDKAEVRRIHTYKQLYDVMERHPQLGRIRAAAIARYWDTFVVDALVGNFDRHKENFGYLVNRDTGDIALAPVYDCGSCLYPSLSVEGMREVLASQELIEQRICTFPRAALNLSDDPKHENKASYLDFMRSGQDPNCVAAVFRIYPKIDMEKINGIIENTPCLPEEKKEFYRTMLRYRKELIIDRAHETLLAKRVSTDDTLVESIIDEQCGKVIEPQGKGAEAAKKPMGREGENQGGGLGR